ncbi:MAG TPA: glycogen debranching N-terminal domain-containing protein [Acidimicrobiales bacterium]|nr:glycogen debranching N-terminal domain-containing protein [Acidimicrobiales bacterium]
MADPWNFSGESAPLGQPGGTVTLVEGSAFCISGRSGDISAGSPQGVFFRDTRFLSRFEVRVNGQQPEPLASTPTDPFSALFASRTRPRPGRADSTLMVFRSRYLGRGMREDITVRNFGDEPAYCSIELVVEADFADLFEVKEDRVTLEGERLSEAVGDGLVFRYRRGTLRRGARLAFGAKPTQLTSDAAVYEVIVPARGSWSTCVQLIPIIEGEEIEPRYKCGEPVERATPVERLAKWRRNLPMVDTDHEGLRKVLARSAEDLGALRIFDPEFPERAVVAAGAPWFMTLFGRDSLLTSWFALLVDPDLALGVLQTLARFQGQKVDPRNDEEPGRILHEMRFGDAASLSLGGGRIYYGSADSTPLFVMLLGELRRWGLASEVVDSLLPHADRAMAWIDEYGDKNGDGYVEYQRGSDRGLANQGWKDSWDGIRFADGEVARAPISLCEVQAYVYGAYLARMHFAWEVGDEAVAARYSEKAMSLKERFNRDFWLEDRGWFAVGLDGQGRKIDSLASNMGHCLWTGIVDEDKAARVASRLLSDEMFSGWGVRTLASSMGGYNPISYHCGSVWPHDNAVVAAGLMRYGFVDAAHRVVLAQLDAALSQGARLPELFSGLDRAEFPTVVSYPTSCSPQAWAAAAPLLFLRTLLRLDPWMPHGKVWLSPVLPEGIGRLRVERIPLMGGRVSVEVSDGNVKIEGLPPEFEVVTEPRHPLSAL